MPRGKKKIGIEYIEIKGLFGWLDHRIRLYTAERITIIHGPNGIGKTTILRMIDALFNRKFTVIYNIKFRNMILKLTDGQELYLSKSGDKLSIELRKEEESLARHLIAPPKNIRRDFPFFMIEYLVPHLERTGAYQWLDPYNGLTLSLDEVIMTYGERFPLSVVKVEEKLNDTIAKALDSVSVYFIEAQRLLIPDIIKDMRRRPHSIDRVLLKAAIEQDAEDMRKRIHDVLRQSGSVAASLDRTFPARLLQGDLPPEATQDTIKKRYDDQKQYRNRLMEAGLLDLEELVDLPLSSLNAAEQRVLWHYLGDVQKKFSVYDDLLKRVELFMDIINSKGFIKKKLIVDKEYGYRFITNVQDGLDENTLPLSTLSSGEQHEVVLVYHLLFKASPNSLILVDEPELSLHVTWQHSFLDDMERISRLADLDFLVATHSPSIVRTRSNLMVALSAGEEKC